MTWRRQLTPADVAAVRALAGAAEAADGAPPLSEQVLLHLSDPGNHLLAHDGGGLVGYASLDADGGAELVVAPDARRRGTGRHLAEALLARSPALAVWAHGEHPGAAPLATALGLRPVRVLHLMSRPLADPLPPVALPPGTALRPFVVGQDEQAWTALNARAFASHPEQGRWGVEEVLLREREPWFDPAGFLLAERDGALVAFHWTKVEGGVGEVYVVGVDPSAQGGGLGRAVVLAGLHHLQDRGLPTVVLYVDDDNTGARRLYEGLGFVTASRDVRWATAPVALELE